MRYFDDLAAALAALDRAALDELRDAVRATEGIVWICGNGGSHAIAAHWACDLVKAAGRRAVVLGANTATLTAYANDIAYDHSVSQELFALAREHDLLVCLSCSGASANVIQALYQARQIGLPAVLITSPLAPRAPAGVSVVRVPSEDYGVIEDCFSAIGHWLTKELSG